MDGSVMFEPLSADEVSAASNAIPQVGSKRPIVPVPADAPPMNFKHPKLGCPDRSWAYHDAESRLVGYVCRWDFADAEGTLQKEVLPICFCDLGNGKLGWRSKLVRPPADRYAKQQLLHRGDPPRLGRRRAHLQSGLGCNLVGPARLAL